MQRRTALGYEALDTKLARHAKPAYILQLCFYNEQLARIQGREPRAHPRAARLRRAASLPAARSSAPTTGASARGSSEFVADPPPTEPYPSTTAASATSSRSATRGGTRSTTSRRVAGHPAHADRASSPPPGSRRSPRSGARPPSRAAGIAAGHVRRSSASRPSSSSARARPAQTRYVLLEPQPERGFALLPDPSPGDLFFDFEGNPFWDRDGSLEYLWGILDVDGDFTPLHAHDHATERARVRDSSSTSCTSGSRAYPDLHVYHYAAYEITALGG